MQVTSFGQAAIRFGKATDVQTSRIRELAEKGFGPEVAALVEPETAVSYSSLKHMLKAVQEGKEYGYQGPKGQNESVAHREAYDLFEQRIQAGQIPSDGFFHIFEHVTYSTRLGAKFAELFFSTLARRNNAEVASSPEPNLFRIEVFREGKEVLTHRSDSLAWVKRWRGLEGSGDSKQ